MKKKTKDYLKFINVDIYQDDEMFCVNSDTALLGMFMNFPKSKTVLDIGTNNGALLIYANRFSPMLLVGIDIFDEALEIAKENLLMNDIKAELYNSRLEDFNHESFDVIICNPPFFKEENKRYNYYKEVAMFEGELSLDVLLYNIKRLLKDNGSAFLIYPANRFLEFTLGCEKYGFKLMEIQFVFDSNKEVASRFLVKLKKGKMTSAKILKPVFIKDGKIQIDNL